jgi:hypothetical protein
LIRLSAFFLALSGIVMTDGAPVLADSPLRISISKTVNAYVTALNPPDSFQLDSLTVRTTSKTAIYKLEKNGDKILFPVDGILVGSHVTVHGKADAQKQEIIADNVVVSTEEIPQKAIGAGLMDGPPALSASGKALTGTVKADGYRLTVTSKTEVTLSGGNSQSGQPSPKHVGRVQGLSSTRRQSGREQEVFYPVERSDKEQRYAKSSDFKIDPPNYDREHRVRFTFSCKR